MAKNMATFPAKGKGVVVREFVLASLKRNAPPKSRRPASR
jgi:hypothetical protein